MLGYIRQWVDDGVFHYVSMKSSTYSLWKKLEDLYKRKTIENKLFLIRKLVNLKYKEGCFITEHLNEIQIIINRLYYMKMTLDDELQAKLSTRQLGDIGRVSKQLDTRQRGQHEPRNRKFAEWRDGKSVGHFIIGSSCHIKLREKSTKGSHKIVASPEEDQSRWRTSSVTIVRRWDTWRRNATSTRKIIKITTKMKKNPKQRMPLQIQQKNVSFLCFLLVKIIVYVLYVKVRIGWSTLEYPAV